MATARISQEVPSIGDIDVEDRLPASLQLWRKSIETLWDALSAPSQVVSNPRATWWYPWLSLEPYFSMKGYSLFIYDPSSPSKLPFTPGSPAIDSFGLYGDRSTMARTCFDMNATVFGARDRQGRDVVIKAIARLSQINPEGLDEYNILKALNSEPMKSDSRNATVTVLDFIEIGPWRFATMPLLDDCAVYPFITALECLDFSCQILDMKALAYLHENGIAHLDVSHENIVMNHHGKVPDRFVKEESQIFKVQPVPEFRSTFPIKYYLIDFGYSVRVPGGVNPDKFLIEARRTCRRNPVPETVGTGMFNPFAADVYQAAQLFYSWFGVIHPEVPGLLELFQDMCSVTPSCRPSMSRASLRMHQMRHQLSKRDGCQKGELEFFDYIPVPTPSQL